MPDKRPNQLVFRPCYFKPMASLLTIIGAAAISALTFAMAQAGWTNRWFVWAMFSLAALLAIAAVEWSYFQARTPFINDVPQSLASSCVAWFLMGIVPAWWSACS